MGGGGETEAGGDADERADAGYEIARQCAREHGLNLGAIEL